MPIIVPYKRQELINALDSIKTKIPTGAVKRGFNRAAMKQVGHLPQTHEEKLDTIAAFHKVSCCELTIDQVAEWESLIINKFIEAYQEQGLSHTEAWAMVIQTNGRMNDVKE